jgi:hypothetical protein
MNKKKILLAISILIVASQACMFGGQNIGGDSQAQPTYTALPTYTPFPTRQAPATLVPTQAQMVPTNAPVIPTNAPATQQPAVQNNGAICSFGNPGNLDNMPKTVIELAPMNTWFHRVFNVRLFNEANNWGGADSWNHAYALGPNSGGSWTSHGNPGQFVYRGTSTHLEWCLGVATSSQYFAEFMNGSTAENAAINVRIAPFSNVTVVTASGKTITQETSDMGDITIILPKDGVITISVDYTTDAPTHESLVWVGPYDRSEHINTIDAR